MGTTTELNDLVTELNRVHPGGMADWSLPDMKGGFPDFVTASTGYERHFTKQARDLLKLVATHIFENRRDFSAVIQIDNFHRLVKQCVANLHSEGAFVKDGLPKNWNQKLESLIERELPRMQRAFTHYFPAWTLGMETKTPFTLGPVTIMTREHWINSVDFSQPLKEQYLGQPEKNLNWKQTLNDALKNPSEDGKPDGLALDVYGAIKECPSVVKITVGGFERELSRKIGEIVCKSALDATSLLFGVRDCFYKQALCDERLPPMDSRSIIETDGHLWPLGSTWGPRVNHHSSTSVMAYLSKCTDILAAFGQILDAQIPPTTFRNPNLAKRWATALNWAAEGGRESNDAVALAKIATSLDVLSCGGKAGGITEMLESLLKTDRKTEIVKGANPRTLKQVVDDVYNGGRSQILHGTHFDRLKPFQDQRGQASSLARLALIEAALRLVKFTGIDGDKAFRTMPE